MKKEFVFIVLLLLIAPMLISSVSAGHNFLERTFGAVENGRYVSPGEIAEKEAKIESVKESPLLTGIGMYFFGLRDMEDTEVAEEYGTTSVIIIFILIWLILFLTFSDILSMFSAFSPWVAWIVGFALTIIAANLKIIQIVAIWFINITAIFGTISVFIGLIMAFVAFIALSIGTTGLQAWAVKRKMGIEAHKGRTEMSEGVVTLRKAGIDVMKGTASKKGWWIILLVVLGIAVALWVISSFM
jgi:hypothetical protein